MSPCELRDNIGRVLRDVEAGESFRVTVDGRPVDDLIPFLSRQRVFVSREEVLEILDRARLDAEFAIDIESIVGATIEGEQ
jgi:antitoxin (DNA-binding transcriptional repressor) of toxin-antitoxin stability system